MANFARGLAAGLESGYKLGEALRQKRMRDEFQKISSTKETDYSGFTEEQQKQIEAMRNAGLNPYDEQGNVLPIEQRKPYYSVQESQIDPRTGQLFAGEREGQFNYRIQPNFSVQGSAGVNEPAGLVNMGATPMVSYLGREYERSAFTPEAREAAQYRAMADIMARENPAEGLRMRQQLRAEERATGAEQRAIAGEKRTAELFPGQLESQEQQLAAGKLGISKGQREETKAQTLENVDKIYASWWKEQTKGKKEISDDDRVAGMQKRATLLVEHGLNDEAEKLMGTHMNYALNTIIKQSKERDNAIGPVLTALNSGDTKPAVDFYHKFVPDGANVKDIKLQKDGSLIVTRTTLDGAKLPDVKIQSIAHLSADINALSDPKVLATFTQNQIENNFRSRGLNIQEAEAKSTKEYRTKTIGLREKELDRPTAASVIPLVNKEGKQILYDIVNNKEVKLPEGYQPAKIDTSLTKSEKDIKDDAQSDPKWKRSTLEERARMIKDRGGDPEKILGIKGRPNPYAEE